MLFIAQRCVVWFGVSDIAAAKEKILAQNGLKTIFNFAEAAESLKVSEERLDELRIVIR